MSADPIFTGTFAEQRAAESNSDRLVFQFTRHVIKLVNRDWQWKSTLGNPLLSTADMVSEGMSVLVVCSREFNDWARQRGDDPYSEALFWGYARARITHALQEYSAPDSRKTRTMASLEKAAGDDTEEDYPEEDLVRTQLARFQPTSTLHEEIAAFANSMHRDFRVALALYAFEELPNDLMLELLDVGPTGLNYLISGGARNVLIFAQSRVLHQVVNLDYAERTTQRPDAQALVDYLAEQYECDVDTWLRWVAHCYRLDSHYLAGILERAHGRYTRRSYVRAHNRLFTDEQVTEIRLAFRNGTTARELSHQYSCDPKTIYNTLNGRQSNGNQNYGDVE